MAITIGIYDLFPYTIPGLLYLYVTFEFFRQIGVAQYGIVNLANFPSGIWVLAIVLLAVAAHLAGHIFDFFASRFVNRLFRRQRITDTVLDRFKERYPKLNIQFESKDWELLFALLRQRTHEHSRTMDSLEANSIMLRNISFALFLLALLEIHQLIIGYDNIGLVLTVLTLAFCYVASRRSRMFYHWFFREIFQASLNYGKSLEEVIAFRDGVETTPKKRVPSKSKTSGK